MPGRRDAAPSVAERRAAFRRASEERPGYARTERAIAAALRGMWAAARSRVEASSVLVGAADPIRASDAATEQDAADAALRLGDAEAAALLAEARRYGVALDVSWTIVSPMAAAAVANLGTRIAYVTEAERARIMAVLEAAFLDGASVRDAAAALRAAEGLSRARAALIARTELNAVSNLASLAVVRSGNYAAVRAGESALFASKLWIAANDSRTRATHRAANGQVVRVGEPFLVGGARLDSPHDPFGPAAEVVNCRCTIGWVE